jgi:hypothetical protein
MVHNAVEASVYASRNLPKVIVDHEPSFPKGHEMKKMSNTFRDEAYDTLLGGEADCHALSNMNGRATHTLSERKTLDSEGAPPLFTSIRSTLGQIPDPSGPKRL